MRIKITTYIFYSTRYCLLKHGMYLLVCFSIQYYFPLHLTSLCSAIYMKFDVWSLNSLSTIKHINVLNVVRANA
jgi:hypothetical protein